MKILLAVRNLLVITDLPLWVRKGVDTMMQRWEKELLNAHAADALTISGQVGLVHLMKVFKEVRCWWLGMYGLGLAVEVLGA